MRFAPLIVVLLLTFASMQSIARGGPHIPVAAIESLQEDLARLEGIESALEQRRACKRMVRQGQRLITEQPDAPNRFRVLSVIMAGQQHLLEIDNSDRSRDAFLKSCQALAQAPDEEAERRLPADVILTHVALADSDGSTNEVAAIITGLVSRYEGTEAEPDSLMVGAVLAKSVGDATLLEAFRETLSDRFADHPKVKAFQRELFGKRERALVFRGTYALADDRSICFPNDRLGHLYLVCFWSEELDYLEERLLEIKAVQEKVPGRFEVFSFNLDELPDSGQGTLRRLGLDWTTVALPGGVDSDAYLGYGHMTKSPFAFLAVNERGYIRGKSNSRQMPSVEDDVSAILSSREVAIRDLSWFAHLQSLIIGDFLVADLPTAIPSSLLPADELRTIQECFTAPEVRCRLSGVEALGYYQKVEALCRAVITRHPDDPALHLLKNRQIVALMGMWNLTGDATYIERAASVSEDLSGRDLSSEDRIVSAFCLARSGLRKHPGDAETIIASFIDACGGEDASGMAHAAAIILTLDADHRDLYLKHRATIRDRFAQDARTWPVASFLLDRESSRTLFDASGVYGAAYRHTQCRLDDVPPMPFIGDFTTLDGRDIQFPDDTDGKHNLVVLLEPPDDVEDAALQGELLDGYQQAISDHSHNELKLLVGFLSDDLDLVKTIVSQNKWTFDVACIPGGIRGPLALQLGAFSTTMLPKTFVVSPEGEIEGVYDGLFSVRDYYGKLQSRNRHGELDILRSVKLRIRAYDTRMGRAALVRQDYGEAARRLHLSFPRNPVNKHNHNARYSYQANKALGNWDAALRDIDICLKDPSYRSKEWRARNGREREEILKKIEQEKKPPEPDSGD